MSGFPNFSFQTPLFSSFQYPPNINTNNEYNLEDNDRMINDTASMYRNLTQTMRDMTIGYNTVINSYNQNMTRSITLLDEYRRDITRLQTHLLNRRFLRESSNVSQSTNQTTPGNSQQNTRQTTRQTTRNSNQQVGSNLSERQVNRRARQIRQTPRSQVFSHAGLNNTLFSNVFTLPQNLFQNLNYNFENVVVRPSQEQIDNAVEQLIYTEDENLINTRCPITMDDFTVGERLLRIRHCGHTFREDSINNWFTTNVRCPVCRYDIRDYGTNSSSSDVSMNTNNTNETEDDNNENTNNSLDELSEQLTSLFSNIIQRTANQTTDASLNRHYTLDIPITVTTRYEEEDDDDDGIEID